MQIAEHILADTPRENREDLDRALQIAVQLDLDNVIRKIATGGHLGAEKYRAAATIENLTFVADRNYGVNGAEVRGTTGNVLYKSYGNGRRLEVFHPGPWVDRVIEIAAGIADCDNLPDQMAAEGKVSTGPFSADKGWEAPFERPEKEQVQLPPATDVTSEPAAHETASPEPSVPAAEEASATPSAATPESTETEITDAPAADAETAGS